MTKSNETERLRESATLTRRQRAVLPHLLSTPSLEEGCRKARVSRTTVYEWLKEPGFQAELKRLRKVLLDETLERLRLALTEAVNKLLELLRTERQPGIQLRAALGLLDHGLKAVELQDLESRLEAVEQHVQEQRGR